MGKIKTYIKLLLIAATSLSMALLGKALPALALETPNITQASGDLLIEDILRSVGDWMIGLAATLGIIFLVYGGIKYITGGPKAEEEAKKIIINSIIGLVVIALSAVLVNFAFKVVSGNLTWVN